MSKTVVVVSLVLAVVSMIAGVVLLRPGAGTGGNTEHAVFSVLTSEQIAVTHQIELESPTGFTLGQNTWNHAVLSMDSSGTWWATFSEDEFVVGPTVFSWPVDETRVRSMLRVLGSLEVRPVDRTGDAQREFADDHRIGIKLRGEGWVRFRMSEPKLGGVVYATNENDRTTTSAWPIDVFDVLYSPGPVAWLDMHCFAGVGAADRVQIQVDTSVVDLRRAGSRWSMAKPVLGSVDASSVEQIVKGLGELEASSIAVSSDTESTAAPHDGSQRSVSIFVGETARDARTGVAETAVVTLRTTMPTNASLDVKHTQTVYIKREVPGRESLQIVAAKVDTEQMEHLLAAPTSVISRVSVNHPPTDIGVVNLTTSDGSSFVLHRTLDGWAHKNEAGEIELFAPGVQSAAAEFVRMLCETNVDPDSIRILFNAGEQALDTNTTIEFQTLSGLSIVTLDLRIELRQDNQTGLGESWYVAVCRNGRVERAYPSGSLDSQLQIVLQSLAK